MTHKLKVSVLVVIVNLGWTSSSFAGWKEWKDWALRRTSQTPPILAQPLLDSEAPPQVAQQPANPAQELAEWVDVTQDGDIEAPTQAPIVPPAPAQDQDAMVAHPAAGQTPDTSGAPSGNDHVTVHIPQPAQDVPPPPSIIPAAVAFTVASAALPQCGNPAAAPDPIPSPTQQAFLSAVLVQIGIVSHFISRPFRWLFARMMSSCQYIGGKRS